MSSTRATPGGEEPLLDVPEPAAPARPAAKAAPAKAAKAVKPPAAKKAVPPATEPDAQQGDMLANLLASERPAAAPGGGGAEELSIPLGALMPGRPDPENDLVTLSVRVPRYVLSALTTAASLSGGRGMVQRLAAEALKSTLPPALLNQAYLNVSPDGRPRPNG